MDRVNEALGLFRDGYACSQAVLMPYADDLRLTSDQAAQLGSGFGGGMRLGSACGAATGAIMVLGLALCDEDCAAGGDRDSVKAAVLEFGRRFVEQMGSLDCEGILGCDLRTPEGAARAEEQKLFETTCPDAVRAAATILEDMLPSE